MALPIFIITVFVSAFLLFLVQPIVGKLILPKLGGTPQVWNTCMVFFQSALLLGYAYTHSVSTRLKLRQQLMVHCGLLILPVLIMLAFPMYSEVKAWNFPAGTNPIVSTLTLLAIIVGVPFFVVSTSAPLLQKWFAYSGHATAKDPYFLYAASNLGSLLSLYFYPLAIEPNFFLSIQSWIWFGGYIALAACIVACVYSIFKLAPPDSVLAAEMAAESAPPAPAPEAPAPAPAPAVEASTAVKSGPAPGGGPGTRGIQRKKGLKLGGKPLDDDKPGAAAAAMPDISYGANAEMTWWRRIRWVLLAFVPSSLMLGVTSYVSTDLSPFVYVWIVPLSLYLLSFILVYMQFWTGKRIFSMGTGYTVHDAVNFVYWPLGILVLAFIVLTRGVDPGTATLLIMFGFFGCALGAHGELAKDRPSTRYLTEYFLLMSVGGMLGGVFNGIMAPVVFQRGVVEFHIAIVIACMVRPQYVETGWFEELLYSAFPGFRGWVQTQGDEMAKSMGRQPQQSTYLFSYFLDVVFGLFILSIVYYLSVKLNFHTRDGRETLISWMKFLPVPKTQGGMQFAFRLLVFLIPMVFCFFFAGRPVRMALGVAALLSGHLWFAAGDDSGILEARRTYFGVLRVQMDAEQPGDEEEARNFDAFRKDKEGRVAGVPYTYLMHGTTYHGRNYRAPKGDDRLNRKDDLSRLATTYYHRYGPVGVVMERYNWFKGEQNSFRADARLPASMIGQITASFGTGQLPLPAVVETWSEPPFATIGLGTGTMASYARPYQHMTYYEIDEVIREFSLPYDDPETYKPLESEARFTYLQNAIRRGVNLEVIMGDARQSLDYDRERFNIENSFIYSFDFTKKKFNAPVHPQTVVDPKTDKKFAPFSWRDGYYKVINVDAFSSDAIPIHLVTKQAIALYLSKMTEDGVLCVHTSNRHMDLVIPVARIVMELSKEAEKEAEDKLAAMSDSELRAAGLGDPKAREAYVNKRKIHCRVGKDGAEREKYMGHFSSEYVMIFRGEGAEVGPEGQPWNFALHLEQQKKLKNQLVDEKRMRSDGGAPPGFQILNASIAWDNPFEEHEVWVGRRRVNRPVKAADPLWTDDFSHILSVVRWHWPWD